MCSFSLLSITYHTLACRAGGAPKPFPKSITPQGRPGALFTFTHFRLELMLSAKFLLHALTLSWPCSELGLMVGSKPTEHTLTAIGADVSLEFLFVEMTMIP